jgi:Domain of unknown function (DUF4124)
MKLPASLLLALCLVSPWLSADIFKCSDGKGNDKYQNFPCPIDSIGSKATAAPPAEQTSKAAPQGAQRAVAPQAVPSGKQPEAGMKMNDVRAAWGTPKSTEVIKGIEIWYYETASGPRAVRFDRTGTVLLVTEAEAPHQDSDTDDQEPSKR